MFLIHKKAINSVRLLRTNMQSEDCGVRILITVTVHKNL